MPEGDSKNLDLIAQTYHIHRTPDHHIEALIQEYEIRWLIGSLQNCNSVVDLGFGDGIIAPQLAKLFKLTVVEGSKLLAEAAQISLTAVNHQTQVVHTRFEDFVPAEKVDAVIAAHVLEHVDDPALLMSRIRSWLQPHGRAIVVVPNSHSLHRRVALEMRLIESLEQLSERDHVVGHQRVFGPDSILELVSSAGFRVEERRGFFVKPLSNSQMIEWPLDVLAALNRVAECFPFEWCSNLGLVLSRD